MRTFLSAALILALVGGAAGAQGIISAEVIPNPTANPGAGFMIDISAKEPMTMFTGCGYSGVFADSPNGPAVLTLFFCPFLLVNVGPGVTHTGFWNGNDDSGSPVPPGLYFVEVKGTSNVTGVQHTEYFPVRVDDPQSLNPHPVLATTSPLIRNQNTTLTIDDPSDPLGTYVLLASFTTNTGLQINPAEFLALDQDFLFDLTLNNLVSPVHSDFIGTLDGAGHTSLPTFSTPNIATLQGWPVAFQAAVIGANGLRLTNPISRIIN